MNGCGDAAPHRARGLPMPNNTLLGLDRPTWMPKGCPNGRSSGTNDSSSRHRAACRWGRPWTSCRLVVHLLLTAYLHTCVNRSNVAAAKQPPNFLIVLTDDQDYLMDGSARQYMPKLHSLMGDQGLELRNFVVSMAWCCPSRASLLTGRYVHNTNITSSSMPRGGAEVFMRSDLPTDYLPVWLQGLGYNTYFAGKFLNSLQRTGPNHCPKGWTVFEGLLDGYNHTYRSWYTNSVYSDNCNGMQTFYNTYQTDIIRDKGLKLINKAVQSGKPFFIQLAPVAPHDQGDGKEAVPADKDKDAFTDAVMPESPNWGVPLPDAQFLSNPAPYNKTFSQTKWLQRQRTVVAVDDMMETLLQHLDTLGQLNNTYIIYTSDNGFHLGQHGLTYEKFTPYEEDVRVPMFIRGPGIPHGIKSDYPSTMVDITATVMTLAGGPLLPQLDGVPFPLQAIAAGQAGSVYVGERSPSPSPEPYLPVHMMEGTSPPTPSPAPTPVPIPVHMLGDGTPSPTPSPAPIPVHMLGRATPAPSPLPAPLPVHMLGGVPSQVPAATTPVHLLGDASPSTSPTPVPIHMLGGSAPLPVSAPVHMMQKRVKSVVSQDSSRSDVTVPISPPVIPDSTTTAVADHAGTATQLTQDNRAVATQLEESSSSVQSPDLAVDVLAQLGEISGASKPVGSDQEDSTGYDVYAPYEEDSSEVSVADLGAVASGHIASPQPATHGSPMGPLLHPPADVLTSHNSSTTSTANHTPDRNSTLPDPPGRISAGNSPAGTASNGSLPSSFGLQSGTAVAGPVDSYTASSAGHNNTSQAGHNYTLPEESSEPPAAAATTGGGGGITPWSPSPVESSPSPPPAEHNSTQGQGPGDNTSQHPAVHNSTAAQSTGNNTTAPPAAGNSTQGLHSGTNTVPSPAGLGSQVPSPVLMPSPALMPSPTGHNATVPSPAGSMGGTLPGNATSTQPDKHNSTSTIPDVQDSTSPKAVALNSTLTPAPGTNVTTPSPVDNHTISLQPAHGDNTSPPPAYNTSAPQQPSPQPANISPQPPSQHNTSLPTSNQNNSNATAAGDATSPAPATQHTNQTLPSAPDEPPAPPHHANSTSPPAHNGSFPSPHVPYVPSPSPTSPSSSPPPSPAASPSSSPAPSPAHSTDGSRNATPTYIRDTIMIEGWLDITMPHLYRKAYRSVRVCTPYSLPATSVTQMVDYEVFMGLTCYKYTLWCIPKNPHTKKDSVLRELYVLSADPYELANLLPSQDIAVQKLVQRLDAVLSVMAYCKGATCRLPWLVLHPDGAALSLADAMHEKHDAQYAAYTTFSYNKCSVWYDPADEQVDAGIRLSLAQAQAVADGDPYANQAHIGGDYADYGNSTVIDTGGDAGSNPSPSPSNSNSNSSQGSFWGWLNSVP